MAPSTRVQGVVIFIFCLEMDFYLLVVVRHSRDRGVAEFVIRRRTVVAVLGLFCAKDNRDTRVQFTANPV